MYRICENKYGYYKIQKRQVEIKLFGITIRKEKWKNTAYNCETNELTLFRTPESAQLQIDRFTKKDQKQNKEWECTDVDS